MEVAGSVGRHVRNIDRTDRAGFGAAFAFEDEVGGLARVLAPGSVEDHGGADRGPARRDRKRRAYAGSRRCRWAAGSRRCRWADWGHGSSGRTAPGQNDGAKGDAQRLHRGLNEAARREVTPVPRARSKVSLW